MKNAIVKIAKIQTLALSSNFDISYPGKFVCWLVGQPRSVLRARASSINFSEIFLRFSRSISIPLVENNFCPISKTSFPSNWFGFGTLTIIYINYII